LVNLDRIAELVVVVVAGDLLIDDRVGSGRRRERPAFPTGSTRRRLRSEVVDARRDDLNRRRKVDVWRTGRNARDDGLHHGLTAIDAPSVLRVALVVGQAGRHTRKTFVGPVFSPVGRPPRLGWWLATRMPAGRPWAPRCVFFSRIRNPTSSAILVSKPRTPDEI
jgi:hypothetical protein